MGFCRSAPVFNPSRSQYNDFLPAGDTTLHMYAKVAIAQQRHWFSPGPSAPCCAACQPPQVVQITCMDDYGKHASSVIGVVYQAAQLACCPEVGVFFVVPAEHRRGGDACRVVETCHGELSGLGLLRQKMLSALSSTRMVS